MNRNHFYNSRDVHAQADVHSQVVWPRKRRDELERAGVEAADDALGTADKNVVAADDDAVGAVRPQLDPLVEQSAVVEFAQKSGPGDGVGAVSAVAFSAGHVAEIVIALLAEDGQSTHERYSHFVLKHTKKKLDIGTKFILQGLRPCTLEFTATRILYYKSKLNDFIIKFVIRMIQVYVHRCSSVETRGIVELNVHRR